MSTVVASMLGVGLIRSVLKRERELADIAFGYLPAAGGQVLLPNKLVKKRERTKVDLPRPDSPWNKKARVLL